MVPGSGHGRRPFPPIRAIALPRARRNRTRGPPDPVPAGLDRRTTRRAATHGATAATTVCRPMVPYMNQRIGSSPGSIAVQAAEVVAAVAGMAASGRSVRILTGPASWVSSRGGRVAPGAAGSDIGSMSRPERWRRSSQAVRPSSATIIGRGPDEGDRVRPDDDERRAGQHRSHPG